MTRQAIFYFGIVLCMALWGLADASHHAKTRAAIREACEAQP